MRRRPSVLLASVVSLTVGLLLGASSARLAEGAGDGPPLRVSLRAAAASQLLPTAPCA
jgi:hypothetical protein